MQTQPPTKINADLTKFTEQYGSNFCPAPFEHVIIYGDEVMTCCKTKVPIGNLKDNTLKEIYEGPIIEQDVARVTHVTSPADMVAAGRDVERIVLFRAVKFYIERRVLLNKHKTIVFN